ncbi:glutamate 5-kinase [Thermodesulfobacterium sp. TA1]|uniref:glutamate 5-kinase n=1 Tax=Thermodesulfobacterium sp. TA1 TaxID=2234087 RepID=UPI001231F537|nr:glutamate 5-kinase [Thermodesulfobacterium sp. TA1]QER41247.1 glutamate 5-kinase [Thermodesulfobacterium sp. TA1]
MDRQTRLKKVLKKVKRIVVKVGSAVITNQDEGLNYEVLQNLVYQLQYLVNTGYKVVLVSSGAIACGRAKLKFYKKPLALCEKQALASIGQAALIQAYENLFNQYQIFVSQILLTAEDLSLRDRYLNAKKTFETLLKWGVLPIVNENDTVTTEGIRFSDNDILSALVAGTIEADLLIILSDIDGLYREDPRENPKAERVAEVFKIDETVFKMAGRKPGSLGRGGMYSKLLAAKMVNSMGIPMVILSGKEPFILEKFWQGQEIGTIFWPEERKLSMRKLWIKYYIKPEGRIYIDQGAEQALLEKGKSLLLPGIKKIEGEFPKGACVECINHEGKPIAKGLVAFSSYDLQNFLASEEKPNKEVIHRDNLIVLEEV